MSEIKYLIEMALKNRCNTYKEKINIFSRIWYTFKYIICVLLKRVENNYGTHVVIVFTDNYMSSSSSWGECWNEYAVERGVKNWVAHHYCEGV
jgi:hypothetical protein